MDSRLQDTPNDVLLKRDHDSVDDFEHLSHDSPDDRPEQQQPPPRLIDPPRVDDLLHIGDSFQASDNVLPSALLVDGDVDAKPVPATPPPSADFEKCEAMAQSSDPFQRPLDPVDPKLATMAFVESERAYQPHDERSGNEEILPESPPAPLLPTSSTADDLLSSDTKAADVDNKADTGAGSEERSTDAAIALTEQGKRHETAPSSDVKDLDEEIAVKSSVLPERSSMLDFLGNDTPPKPVDKVKNIMDDDSWNLVEKADLKQPKELEPPSKPLPLLPKETEEAGKHHDKYEMSHDFLLEETVKPSAPPQPRSVNSESESAKRQETPPKPKEPDHRPSRPVDNKKKEEIEIAPKEIFRDIGLDAWFNPERLNPRVAALIYWRDPKTSGIVFGVILSVLLSLAYFSLISVFAYLSLLVLGGTILFRMYRTVLQAVQKTSDGHPFKDILDLDLALPAVKVHEFADVAVAHANAAISELRRLFLVEDFVDSLKFGVLLWCLTYVGSWLNGMTLIIIGVVSLFTLPKIYETNQEQIDQNLALVQAKINEITAKVKAAIPLGKKAEPTKEE